MEAQGNRRKIHLDNLMKHRLTSQELLCTTTENAWKLKEIDGNYVGQPDEAPTDITTIVDNNII